MGRFGQGRASEWKRVEIWEQSFGDNFWGGGWGYRKVNVLKDAQIFCLEMQTERLEPRLAGMWVYGLSINNCLGYTPMSSV